MAHPTLALADAEPMPALAEWLLLWKQKRMKAKELAAEVDEEKEGSEGHEDFEAGPTAAKSEKPTANKQQKKSAGERPATRVDFDALGDNHMELKRQVQGLQGVVLELTSTCTILKNIADMLEHAEKLAVKKAEKKEKKEKSPPTVLAARPIPTSRLKGKTAATCSVHSEWSYPFGNGSAQLAASLWVETGIMC